MGEWSLKSCNAKKGDLSCVNSVSNCQLTADCIAAIIRRLTSYRRSFNCNPSPFEKKHWTSKWNSFCAKILQTRSFRSWFCLQIMNAFYFQRTFALQSSLPFEKLSSNQIDCTTNVHVKNRNLCLRHPSTSGTLTVELSAPAVIIWSSSSDDEIESN